MNTEDAMDLFKKETMKRFKELYPIGKPVLVKSKILSEPFEKDGDVMVHLNGHKAPISIGYVYRHYVPDLVDMIKEKRDQIKELNQSILRADSAQSRQRDEEELKRLKSELDALEAEIAAESTSTKQEVFDTLLAHLLKKVVAICVENKLAMLIHVCIPSSSDPALSYLAVTQDESGGKMVHQIIKDILDGSANVTVVEQFEPANEKDVH